MHRKVLQPPRRPTHGRRVRMAMARADIGRAHRRALPHPPPRTPRTAFACRWSTSAAARALRSTRTSRSGSTRSSRRAIRCLSLIHI
eukprot:7327694-Prymnesium_polylepis.1